MDDILGWVIVLGFGVAGAIAALALFWGRNQPGKSYNPSAGVGLGNPFDSHGGGGAGGIGGAN